MLYWLYFLATLGHCVMLQRFQLTSVRGGRLHGAQRQMSEFGENDSGRVTVNLQLTGFRSEQSTGNAAGRRERDVAAAVNMMS
jgi:hypothetical protein